MLASTRKCFVSFISDPRVLALIIGTLQPVLAQAYMGQSMVEGLFKMICLPIMFIAFLWTLASVFFTQQHLSKALYSLLGSIVFTVLVYSGDRVMQWITAAQGEAR